MGTTCSMIWLVQAITEIISTNLNIFQIRDMYYRWNFRHEIFQKNYTDFWGFWSKKLNRALSKYKWWFLRGLAIIYYQDCKCKISLLVVLTTPLLWFIVISKQFGCIKCEGLRTRGGGGGGTDLERGYGDVRPWRPPFHTSPAAHKGPISSIRVSSQDPLLRRYRNFSLNSLNFHPNFSSQAPKFGNFQLTSPKFGNFQFTSPQIWKFSAHKPPPPFQRQISVRKPHTSEIRATHPYLKKSWVPPPPRGWGGMFIRKYGIWGIFLADTI